MEVVDRTRTHVIIEPQGDQTSEPPVTPDPLHRPRPWHLFALLWYLFALFLQRISQLKVGLATGILLGSLLTGVLIWKFAVTPPTRVNTEWRNNLKLIRMPRNEE